MTEEEKYKEFINIVCEILGFNKPIDILKLCQKTSEFIRPYEMKIKELEQEKCELLGIIQQKDELIEKMKTCSNCNHYNRTYELCQFSLGDEDYDCRNRNWELAE